MIDEKEKTALDASVGADAGQSIQSRTTQIITGETPEINDLEDISQEKLFQMQRMQDPAYLHTVSMNELYETVYEGKQAVIDGLLYAGDIFVCWCAKGWQILLYGAAGLPCQYGAEALGI